jgi:serine/threonine protein kinase
VFRTSGEAFLLIQKLGEGGTAAAYVALPLSTAAFTGAIKPELRQLLDVRRFEEVTIYSCLTPEQISPELAEAAAAPLCVLKVLMTSDPSLVERMEREALCYGVIHDPRVPKLIAAGHHPLPHLALELFRGRTLADLVDERRGRRGSFSWSEVYEIMMALLPAVERIHGQGIVHRDLKPENLVIDRIPGIGVLPRLLDFGIATFVDPTPGLGHLEAVAPTLPHRPITEESGTRPLTPGYAAPEQYYGDRITTAADVYALGVILYELLTGRLPFSGQTVSALMTEMTGRPMTIQRSDLGPESTQRLDHLVRNQMLAYDADRRLKDVGVVRDVLRSIEQLRDEEERRRRAISRSETTGVHRMIPPTPANGHRPSREVPTITQKNPFPWATLIKAIAAVVTTAIVLGNLPRILEFVHGLLSKIP